MSSAVEEEIRELIQKHGAAALGEPLDFYVWLAVFLVIVGVALGTTGSSLRR